jgi:hypothetical protein
MRMVRRLIALVLTLSLALGAAAAMAAGGCAATNEAAAASGCGTCDGADGSGQAQQGCAALTCSAGCVSGPVTGALTPQRIARVTATAPAPPAPHDGLLVRAIPPDHPPPR